MGVHKITQISADRYRTKSQRKIDNRFFVSLLIALAIAGAFALSLLSWLIRMMFAPSGIPTESLVADARTATVWVMISMVIIVLTCLVPGHRELFYLGKVPRHGELFCGFDLLG
jgi:uncharacterized membrane protein YdbT with pleckstrin-like domain